MRKSIPIVLVGLIGLSAVLLFSYEVDQEETSQVAQCKVTVALATAQNSVLPHYYSSVGTLEASQQVLVTAELGGRIAQLHFDSGQSVKKGQLLVTLNTEPERAQQARLNAVLRNAEQRLQRVRQLLPSGAATRQQGDQAAPGRIKGQYQIANIRIDTDLTSAEQFREMVIHSDANGLVRVKDVGNVELGSASTETSAFMDGKG